MKKVLMILILVAVITGGLFAQSDQYKHWVSGEASFFGAGVRYEYMLTPKFSIGGYGFINTLIFWNDWGLVGAARYYPLKVFFVELGAGFGYHSGFQDITYTVNNVKYEYTDLWVGITGFTIVPGLGWKIDVGTPGGFFIQPGIKVPITLGKKKLVFSYSWDNNFESDFGVGVGVIAYCGFGYAF